MSLAHRPTFTLELPVPLDAVQARLRAGLTAPWLEARWARPPGEQDRGLPANDLILNHVLAQRSFWSPWLTLDLRRTEQGGTRIGGRFSPHPSVWIGFLFAYLGLGAVSLFSGVFALVQVWLNGAPTALWALLGTSLVAAGMWWSSQVGQRLARAQMQELRAALDAALGLGATDDDTPAPRTPAA